MAQRPESRAVKPTRARKARLPADDVRQNMVATAPAEAGQKRGRPSTEDKPAAAGARAPAPPNEKTQAATARPSRIRTTTAKTPPEEAVQATLAASPRKGSMAETVDASAAATQAGGRPTAKRARKRNASQPTARRSKRPPLYLAAELGQPIDHEGEPIGAGSPMARSDRELQDYTLQLWQQMQSRRGVNQHVQAMERAGLTIDDLWTTGVTDRLSTSSTPDELRRYRQNLLFRANLLEAILSETVAELRRIETVDPTPASANGPG